MAYIIQQRRDIAKAWSDTNPVLAPGEIGFIVELDENGIQKSSLYKVGDGKHSWNELPLFGFGGNVYNTANAWKGSDLDTTVASQQAVLDKIAEKILASEVGTSTNLENVKVNLEGAISNVINGVEGESEGLIHKLSITQLVQSLVEAEGEFAEDITPEDKAAILASQIVSRAILIDEFNKVWVKIGENQDLNQTDIDTLKTFASTYGPKVDDLEVEVAEHESRISDMETTYTENFEIIGNQMTEHDRFIKGWTEIKEIPSEDPEGEPTTEEIYHKSVDEKIADVDAKYEIMHNIVSNIEYNEIVKTGFEGYPDGTLFLVYELPK